VEDPLALAEQRLAARELRPALDALKEARAQAYEAGDRARLERVRELALELEPLLGGGRAERSCAVLLVAVQESLVLLTERAQREADEPSGSEPQSRGPTRRPGGFSPRREPARAEAPPARPRTEPAAREPRELSGSEPLAPEPEARPEAEEEPAIPEPEGSSDAGEPRLHLGLTVSPGHVKEAETVVLERGERLIGMFAGVVRETRPDGGRGAPRSGDTVRDYLLVTDRGIVLWTRGRAAAVEGYRFAEVTEVRAVRNVLSRSLVVEVGAKRRWFASMTREDAELAAELTRELAGLQA
jgi:hypothetical protein